MRKKIIIGNWKMYKTQKETVQFLDEFNHLTVNKKFTCEFGVAASFTNLSILAEKRKDNFIVAAQNCHEQTQGAFTGEIATNMLEELHVKYVIIGHSERRQYFNETDESINRKLKWIFEHSNLSVILCCGETLAEYEKNKTYEIIAHQIKAALKGLNAQHLARLVIAYEPIWAIGSGKSATSEQAQNICLAIRNIINDLYGSLVANNLRIQYGGSVKPENIKIFLSQPDIDGALVGSASLKVTDFINLLH